VALLLKRKLSGAASTDGLLLAYSLLLVPVMAAADCPLVVVAAARAVFRGRRDPMSVVRLIGAELEAAGRRIAYVEQFAAVGPDAADISAVVEDLEVIERIVLNMQSSMNASLGVAGRGKRDADDGEQCEREDRVTFHDRVLFGKGMFFQRRVIVQITIRSW